MADPAAGRVTELCSVTAALIPTGFNILRWSINHPKAAWRDIFFGSRYWLLFYLPVAVICLTKFFLQYVVIPGPDSVPKPIYGPGFLLYSGYLVVSTLILVAAFFRHLQKAAGVQRIELQFVLLGCAASWAIGITFVLMPVFTDTAVEDDESSGELVAVAAV